VPRVVPASSPQTRNCGNEEDTDRARGQHDADHVVPMIRGRTEPAPDANQSGTQPNTNANEASRWDADAAIATESAASAAVCPSHTQALANSTDQNSLRRQTIK